MRQQERLDFPRSMRTGIILILAFVSGLMLMLLPKAEGYIAAVWVPIFILVFFLPGYLLASVLIKQIEPESLEIFSLGLGLSLVIFPLVSLAIILSYHAVDRLQLLVFTLAIITVLVVFDSLRDNSRVQFSKTSLNLLSSLRRNRRVLAIIVFAVAVRLVSFFYINRNSISSDIDIWLVYEVVEGQLLSSYTSIWHYLGMAPYSYPIIFHLFSASVKILGQLRSSDLLFVNLIPSFIPLLFCYSMIKDLYGERSALLSTFALSTAPIFIFDTLMETFKARALFYVYISAELYCSSQIIIGRKKFWPLLLLFASISSLTYREAVLMNIFIVAILLSATLAKSQLMSMRLAGVVFSILGSILFAVGYIMYTPSLGLVETLASGLAKQGPLIIFCIVGIFFSIKRGRAIDRFLSIIALVGLALALFNWKAADSAPLLLAPLSGVGLVYSSELLRKLKIPRPSINQKIIILAILMVGLVTLAFGLTYYPHKYYLNAKPEIFNEIEATREFISESKPQRGMVIYGTAYTDLSLKQAYSSILVIGPEQRTFFYTYSLHHLVSTDFDPWVIKHPETIYDSTLQLHRSLYTHSGEDLKQFLETFSIQYLITEDTPIADRWAQSNREILQEKFASQQYRVYEVSSTRAHVALLRFIDNNLPKDATILAPYYMSPSINEVRSDSVTKDLEGSLNFNYIHLYERIRGGPDRTKSLDILKTKIRILKELYHDPKQLVSYALGNGFTYIVTDNREVAGELINHDQKLLFSQDNLALFEAKGTAITSNIFTSPELHTLTVNIFEATSFTSERYALTAPAENVHVSLQRDGEKIIDGYTDSTGTTIFHIPSGEYLISATMYDLTVKRQVEVDSYTFAPIIIHQLEEDPMQELFGPFLLLVAALTFIPNVPITTRKR